MSSQAIGFGAITGLALAIALTVFWANRRHWRLAAPAAAVCLVGLCGTAGTLLWLAFGQPRPLTAEAILPPATDQGFARSDSCRACHPDQYGSWHDSYHRTMTQPATPSNVVAPPGTSVGLRSERPDETFMLVE